MTCADEHRSVLAKFLRPIESINKPERYLYASLLCADLWLGLFFSPFISHELGFKNPFEGLALFMLMNPLGWLIALVTFVSLIVLTPYHLFVGPNLVRMRLVLWYVIPITGGLIDAFARDGTFAPAIASLAGIVLIIVGGLLPLMWLNTFKYFASAPEG